MYRFGVLLACLFIRWELELIGFCYDFIRTSFEFYSAFVSLWNRRITVVGVWFGTQVFCPVSAFLNASIGSGLKVFKYGKCCFEPPVKLMLL